jgi:tRNA-modifying protein YgfZ
VLVLVRHDANYGSPNFGFWEVEGVVAGAIFHGVTAIALPPSQYRIATEACGMVDRSERGKLALSGPDAKTFMQGQVSNDVEALSRGQGCYATFLTPKGKMLGDLRILDAGDELLLDTERVALQDLFNMIRRFSLGYEVELHKRTLERGLLSLLGPAAEAVIPGGGESSAAAGGSDVGAGSGGASGVGAGSGGASGVGAGSGGASGVGAGSGGASGVGAGSCGASDPGAGELGAEEHAHAVVSIGGVPVRAIRTDLGIDVLCDAGDREAVRAALSEAGAVEVSEAVAECLRVERGRPRYGLDLDDSVIPQEAALNARAVSFTKGCYVGQETVARLHYRGKPNRHLRGVRLSAPANTGDQLALDGRPVGSLGSVALSPRFGPIALAIVRREAPVGSRVDVGADVTGEVVDLPFE